MIRRYKTEEASQIIGMEKHLMKPLREYGFLIGTRTGHGFVYDSEELEAFILMTRGYDLRNVGAIRLAAQIIQPQKNAALHGRAIAATSAAPEKEGRFHLNK